MLYSGDINRLSGNIPISLLNINNINILESNMFQCDITKSSLPNNDINKSKYSCGSSAYDIPYYTWLGLVFVMIYLVFYLLNTDGIVNNYHYILNII